MTGRPHPPGRPEASGGPGAAPPSVRSGPLDPWSAVEPARLAVLRERLTVVEERIHAAARSAGRDPAELTMIAVSKTRPATDVLALHALGVRHFAENREQEAGPKVAAVADALRASAGVVPWGGRPEKVTPERQWDSSRPSAGAGPVPPVPPVAAAHVAGVPVEDRGLVWHFVGQLQRNKVRAVAEWVHWVHSIDRSRLIEALSRAAMERGRTISVCVQVSLDDPVGGRSEPGYEAVSPGGTARPAVAGPAARGGARPAEVPALADLVARSAGLRLAGVMAVAPRGMPPRPAFARLRAVAERMRIDHPSATVISAGMSGDLADAVAEGATHLRIGTALFGERHGVP